MGAAWVTGERLAILDEAGLNLVDSGGNVPVSWETGDGAPLSTSRVVVALSWKKPHVSVVGVHGDGLTPLAKFESPVTLVGVEDVGGRIILTGMRGEAYELENTLAAWEAHQDRKSEMTCTHATAVLASCGPWLRTLRGNVGIELRDLDAGPVAVGAQARASFATCVVRGRYSGAVPEAFEEIRNIWRAATASLPQPLGRPMMAGPSGTCRSSAAFLGAIRQAVARRRPRAELRRRITFASATTSPCSGSR